MPPDKGKLLPLTCTLKQTLKGSGTQQGDVDFFVQLTTDIQFVYLRRQSVFGQDKNLLTPGPTLDMNNFCMDHNIVAQTQGYHFLLLLISQQFYKEVIQIDYK